MNSGLATALNSIKLNIATALKNSGKSNQSQLVAVSKTFPTEIIKEVYDLGQRDFGENYVDEFIEKSKQVSKCLKTLVA